MLQNKIQECFKKFIEKRIIDYIYSNKDYSIEIINSRKLMFNLVEDFLEKECKNINDKYYVIEKKEFDELYVRRDSLNVDRLAKS